MGRTTAAARPRVVLEATAACRANRTGIARYTICLADALVAAGADLRLGYRLSRWRRRWHRYRPPGVPTLWIQEPFWPLSRGCDVVHGTDARVPAWRAQVRVATLHDVFSLLFDAFASERFREKKRAAYARLARSCDRIIAVSDATRQDFLRFVDYPPERVDVVHEGVSPRFRTLKPAEISRAVAPYRLPARYVLYVGNISARKNVAGLLPGFARAEVDPALHLVLAGTLGHGAKAALAGLSEPGLERRVHLTGYIPNEALPHLYAGAEAFLFPTFYEGFGLPVLEAMACGVPVGGGDRGAVPEVAGAHAVLVDPEDPDAIAAGIPRALSKTEMEREAARLHAAAFTWDRVAKETLEVYARALEQRG